MLDNTDIWARKKFGAETSYIPDFRTRPSPISSQQSMGYVQEDMDHSSRGSIFRLVLKPWDIPGMVQLFVLAQPGDARVGMTRPGRVRYRCSNRARLVSYCALLQLQDRSKTCAVNNFLKATDGGGLGFVLYALWLSTFRPRKGQPRFFRPFPSHQHERMIERPDCAYHECIEHIGYR